MQCPRCQHENPPGQKFCGECGTPAVGAASAGPYADLKNENEGLRRSLTEAHDQQTATAEILYVISRSTTDLQPVLEVVAQNASRLCGAGNVSLYRVEGTQMRKVAEHGPSLTALRVGETRPITRTTVSGRAIIDRTTIHLPDHQSAEAVQEYPDARRDTGIRTTIGIPLLREGIAIGVFTAYRTESRPFSEREVALLQTFADQAVIAIENVRLFKELQERNRDLTTALDRQTATSEILRVISSSLTDVQPVFDAIARNAVTLCSGIRALVLRFDGVMLHVAGHHNIDPHGVEQIGRAFPHRPGRDAPVDRAFLDRSVVHVPDLQAAASEFAASTARRRGVGSMLAVPLLREQEAVGVIGLAREVVGPFSPEQIEVLQTFADQAVIAIENVRLFKELQASNRSLTESLEQQTTTSEILSVISRSPTNIQPVLDAVARSAMRLCESLDAGIFLRDSDRLLLVAHHGPIPGGQIGEFSLPLDRGTPPGRSVLDGRSIHVADLQAEADEFAMGSELARRLSFRTALSVPLMREGVAIGSIALRRAEAHLFTERQVGLLQTFADQAVIAIENVRLFNETKEALEQQTATSEILRIIAGSPTDLQPVLNALVESAGRLCEAADTFLLLVEGDQLKVVALHPFVEGGVVSNPIRRDWVAGRAVIEVRTVHVEDLANAQSEFPLGWEIAARLGHRTALATPLVGKGVPIGALFLRRRQVRRFSEKEIALVQTFADQAVIAIENVRLFNELDGANRELSAASQHKSEFLANMSHELRTPLNAIIGFSEVLTDRMFGELNEKQEEYLKDIYASGTHLLSLINDILDLSKIEAGRMELELTGFDLPQAIDNALILVRERAGRRGITLEHSVDERLGEIRGDERKVKQVLLNILSNALKFTPEGGRVEVRAGMVDGMAEVSVTDTGVGIAPEDQEKVFEEFRQVGTADKKAEGTGLGLTLCRKFIELHGGKIWVKSQTGEGSTFTFTIPIRRGE